MNNTQVALISITQHGNDKAIYLNGENLHCSDPSVGDDVSVLIYLARKLAGIHQTRLVEINHSPMKNWNWNEVENDLKAQGKLLDGLKTYQLEHTYINSEGCIEESVISFDAVTLEEAVQKLIIFYKPMVGKLLTIKLPCEETTSMLLVRGENEFVEE